MNKDSEFIPFRLFSIRKQNKENHPDLQEMILEAARRVLETFFTRTADVKEVENSPIYQESQNLYRQLSNEVGAGRKGN